MARKRDRAKRNGSAKRKRAPKPGQPAKWHNCPNGKRIPVCGIIMRVGSAIAELPETIANPPQTA